MKHKRIGIVGGTGFVGRQLTAELTRRGYPTRVLTRRRARHRELLVLPTCELVETNVHDSEKLTSALAGCDAVVNLAGILNERAPGPSRAPRAEAVSDETPESGSDAHDDFQAVHVALAQNVARACRSTGIERVLHMSALGASSAGPSRYLETKAIGEDATHSLSLEGVAVTSFRPSVIFGPGDSFFNRFATVLKISPFVLPLACAHARFAPVYLGDVVNAFASSIEDAATFGRRYELCGPHVYTLGELVAYTAEVAGLSRRVLALGDGLARLQAAVLDYAPGKPFSTDNYLSLQVDSVCTGGPGLEALGIEPASVEAVVPTYLGQRNRTSRYRGFRSLARRS